jgi:hypothetical protein
MDSSTYSKIGLTADPEHYIEIQLAQHGLEPALKECAGGFPNLAQQFINNRDLQWL